MDQRYINNLLSLERELVNKIHNEIEEELRGDGDPERFMESVRYRVEENFRFMNKFMKKED